MNDMASREVQALGVRDRAVTSLGRAIQIAARLTSDKGREHMTHGLARRLRILHLGLAAILAVAYSSRKQPLSDDEQLDLTLHLNSFYLHIRGAWIISPGASSMSSTSSEPRRKRRLLNQRSTFSVRRSWGNLRPLRQILRLPCGDMRTGRLI